MVAYYYFFKTELNQLIWISIYLINKGGSSGSNMVAAVKLAKDLKPHQKCVVLLPDGIRNYMTKFLSDQWMLERGYFENNQKLWYVFH